MQVKSCEITVIDVDHDGQSFNFNGSELVNHCFGHEFKLLAYNPRTSQIGEVGVIVRSQDAWGSFNGVNVAPQSGQWIVGDKMVPIDDSVCAPGEIF